MHRDRQLRIALHERRVGALRLADDFDEAEPLHDFFPDDPQLHFGQPVAHAAMDAETERQVVARLRPIDDELVRSLDRFFVAVARHVPHQHLVALFDLLALQFGVDGRGAPADDLGHHVRYQAGVVAQLLIFERVLVEGQHTAGNRIAGGVVAADDQQDQVAEKLHRLHVSRRLTVREHRDQIEIFALRLVDAFVPEPREVLEALHQLVAALFVRLDDAGTGCRGRDVGPARQLVAVLERKVEQGRQHLRGELDRHPLDPVERFADRQ